MSSPLSRLITRAAYGATQLPRMAWYIGHGLAMRRMSGRAGQRDHGTTRSRPHTELPVPDRNRLYADMATPLLQDLAKSRLASTRCHRITMVRSAHYSTAPAFSLRICPRSTAGERAAHFVKC